MPPPQHLTQGQHPPTGRQARWHSLADLPLRCHRKHPITLNALLGCLQAWPSLLKLRSANVRLRSRDCAMLKGLCNAHRGLPPLSTAYPHVQVTQLVVSAPAIAVAAACGSNSGAGPVPLTLSLDQQQQQWQAMQQQLQRQQHALTEAQLAAATAQQQQLQQWQQQSQWLQQQQWQTQQHLQQLQQQPQAQQQQIQQLSAPYKKERHTGIKVRHLCAKASECMLPWSNDRTGPSNIHTVNMPVIWRSHAGAIRWRKLHAGLPGQVRPFASSVLVDCDQSYAGPFCAAFYQVVPLLCPLQDV